MDSPVTIDAAFTRPIPFNDTQAEAEGWGLFEIDDLITEIQRLDDGPLIDDKQSGVPAFADDLEAINHVKARARQGSLYHAQALAAAGLSI